MSNLSNYTKTKLILAGIDGWQAELNKCHKDYDVIWLEWANELAILMTKDPNGLQFLKNKKVIMRCHSYEVLSGLFQNIDLTKIDTFIFVAEHVSDVAMQLSSFSDKKLSDKQGVWIIPNGIDIKSFHDIEIAKKIRGTDIAFVGHISHKKGLPLMLHAFKALPDSYRLHVAGEFQDYRFRFYANHILKQFGGTVADRVKFYGKVDNIWSFLLDKHFIVSSSPWEGHPVNIIEGMAMGLKPVVHDFLGASRMYDKKWIWTTIEDFVDIVHGREWEPEQYRKYVIDSGWTDEVEIASIIKILQYLQPQFDGETSLKEAIDEKIEDVKIEMEFDPKDIAARPERKNLEASFIYEPMGFQDWSEYMQKAFGWVTRHLIKSDDGVGIAVSSMARKESIYPEVTGYLIPTVYELGAYDLAKGLAFGVLPFQGSGGGFTAPGDNIETAFDTAQVLRGLLCIIEHYGSIFKDDETYFPVFKNSITRAVNFLLEEFTKDSWFRKNNPNAWSMPGERMTPDQVNLYALAPMIRASRFVEAMFNFEDPMIIVEKFSNRNMLSHFFFYQIDGLLELNELFPKYNLKKVAYDLIMQELLFLPTKTPFMIPAFESDTWICSPGQAQAAICFYKLGMINRFKLTLSGMKLLQHGSGGFYGSYGVVSNEKDANPIPWYFPTSEISWAVKFFLDACIIEQNLKNE